MLGGPCLAKDAWILAEAFDGTLYKPDLLRAAHKVNEELTATCVRRICDAWENINSSDRMPRFAIFGFAFKGSPPTSDMRGSPVHALVREIRAHYPNSLIRGHDSLVASHEIKSLGITHALTCEEMMHNSDIVIFQNNHPDYAALDMTTLSKNLPLGAVIFDFWDQIKPYDIADHVTVMGLGVPTRIPAAIQQQSVRV